MNKAAVIYCQVSTEDQRENGTSLESQAAACQRYAEQNDYNVKATFQESKSGATLDRPMLDQVRDMVRQGLVQAVVFYALDRLSRDETDLLILAREFRNHGCELKCATVNLEDTPQGQLLTTMLGALAQYERAAILERTSRGRMQKVRNGTILRPAVPIFGYSYNEGRYEVVEEEACTVRQVFEWYLRDGLSLKAVAYRLASLGVPTRRGGKWESSAVRNMLTQEAYTLGQWWWGKQDAARGKKRQPRPRSEWIGPVSVPAILPHEYHQAVLERIEANKVACTRNCKTTYLLRGLIVCPRCGRRYSAEKVTLKSGTYLYYKCTKQAAHVLGDDCDGPRVNGKKAEAKAWTWVTSHISDPTLMKQLINASRDTDRVQRERDEANLRSLLDLQQDLDKELDKLVQLFTADLLTLDQFRERKSVLDERRQGVEAQLREIEERQAARAQAAQDEKAAMQLIEQIEQTQRGLSLPALFEALSFEDKRLLLDMLHFKAVATDDGDILISGFIGDELLAFLRAKESENAELSTEHLERVLREDHIERPGHGRYDYQQVAQELRAQFDLLARAEHHQAHTCQRERDAGPRVAPYLLEPEEPAEEDHESGADGEY
jgi:site-specific DNA recombinase